MKLGFIDNYLDEFHANHYPEWLKDASGGEIQAAYAWAVQDAPGGMTTGEWCETYGVQRLSCIEELVEKSDGIVILSPDHPELHEELCQIPLRSGKRVYIDKTFAPDAEAARRIFQIADRHGTPCWSSSALRFASEYETVKKEKIRAVSSRGPGDFGVYAIHQLEPLVSVMGPGAKRVQYIGTREWPALLIEFSDGRRAVMSHHEGDVAFSMAFSYPDHQGMEITVNSDFFRVFIGKLVEFFRTGKEIVPHEETISVIALREAGMKAAACPGEWIPAG